MDLFWCSAQQGTPPGQALAVCKADGNLKKRNGEAGAGDQRRAGSALMGGGRLPGIGFEGKADLIAETRALAL